MIKAKGQIKRKNNHKVTKGVPHQDSQRGPGNDWPPPPPPPGG